MSDMCESPTVAASHSAAHSALSSGQRSCFCRMARSRLNSFGRRRRKCTRRFTNSVAKRSVASLPLAERNCCFDRIHSQLLFGEQTMSGLRLFVLALVSVVIPRIVGAEHPRFDDACLSQIPARMEQLIKEGQIS